MLSITVTFLFVPFGNISLYNITRGHFFYSQTTASAPSFLLSLHPSGTSSFCSLLSLWSAFTQVLVPCHSASLRTCHLFATILLLLSCLCTPSTGCICLLLCLQVEHSCGFFSSPDFCCALPHLPFSIRYLTPNAKSSGAGTL